MARGTKPTRTNQGGLVEVGAGLFDLMASTARGVARGTLGLPGDIETLYDMGRSAVTGEPQRKNVIYNTEDWNKLLPPATPVSGLTGEGAVNPYDEIGTFGSVPVYGATARGAMKGSAKAFDAATGGKTSLSRREFIKKGSAVAGAVVIGGGMAKVLGGLSKAPVNAPVKAAVKHKFNSLAEYNKYLDDQLEGVKLHDYLPDEGFDDYAKQQVKGSIAKADEETYAQVKTIKAKESKGQKLTAKEQEYLDEMSGVLDEFSPQAKAEMKKFKAEVNTLEEMFGGKGDEVWTEYLSNAKPEDLPKWLSGEGPLTINR
jgi:hypothetical protein